MQNITLQNKSSETCWDLEYQKGYLFGTKPSAAALQTIPLLQKQKIVGPSKKLLEFGGGYGRNSHALAKSLNIQCHIVEPSTTAIALGKQYAKNHLVSYIQANAQELIRYQEILSYDTIFHNFCLQLFTLSERKELYSVFSCLLSKKGLLIGSYPVKQFSKKQLRKELSPYFRRVSISTTTAIDLIISKKPISYHLVIAYNNPTPL